MFECLGFPIVLGNMFECLGFPRVLLGLGCLVICFPIVLGQYV